MPCTAMAPCRAGVLVGCSNGGGSTDGTPGIVASYEAECGRIDTSSIVMLSYLQRSTDSQSSRHVKGFFKRVMHLHEAKMACFLELSQETTDDEKADFRASDLACEVKVAIDRFAAHPEERDENLPLINALVFGDANAERGDWYANPEDLGIVLDGLRKAAGRVLWRFASVGD